MAVNGSEVLVFVYDASYDTVEGQFADGYILVGEQTNYSEEESVNLIEANHKLAKHTQSMYGKAEGKISIEALYVKTPAADEKGLEVLKKSFRKKKPVFIKRAAWDGGSNFSDVEYAECLVESLGREFPDDDSATVSVELVMNSDFTADDAFDKSKAIGS